MRVVVLGAGIAGTFTAHFLKELGLSPILLGPKPKYPLNHLAVSPFLAREVDLVATMESLNIYRSMAKVKEAISANFLRKGDYSGVFRLWDEHGVEYEVKEEAPTWMKNAVVENDELVVIGRDYLVPIRRLLGALRSGLPYVGHEAKLLIKNGRAYVRTTGKTFEPDVVVLACGARNKVVASEAGLDLPLKYYICAAALVLGPKELRMSVGDYVNGFYSRPTGTPLDFLGLSVVGDSNFPCKDVERPKLPLNYGEHIEKLVKRRFKGFVKVLKTGYGLCEMSPDSSPIVGRHPQVENLYVVGGLNGYGAYVGPAIARSLAKLIARGEVDLLAEEYDILWFKSWPEDWDVSMEPHRIRPSDVKIKRRSVG